MRAANKSLYMTIGTGVFLSSLVLGLVALYIATRNQWRWGQIIVRTFVVIIGLVIIAAGIMMAFNWYDNRPKIATELWDIKLGETEADVMLKKGKPMEKADDGQGWAYHTSNDYGEWAMVHFTAHKVSDILLIGSDAHPVISIQGLSAYDSLDTVTHKFGAPSKVSDNEDHSSRILSFKAYNVAIEITRNKVTGVYVFDGSSGKGIEFKMGDPDPAPASN